MLRFLLLLVEVMVITVSSQAVSEDVELDNHFETVSLSPRSSTRLWSRVSEDVKFLVFECHSRIHKVIMTESLEPASKKSVNSTDPALVKLLDTVPVGPNSSANGVWVTNPHYNLTLKVLARATSHSTGDPIPGWCGNAKEAVWPRAELTTDWTRDVIRLNFSKASASEHCWDPDSVTYKIYQRYVEDGWDEEDKQAKLFSTLKSFSEVTSIAKWGTEVNSLGHHPDRLVFASYSPVGSVYAVVATATNGSAIYGLAHSYGCHIDSQTGTCPPTPATTLIQVFGACSVFAGLTLALCGHKFFLISQTLFGLYAGVYTAFILLSSFSDLHHQLLFTLVIGCGCVGAVAVAALWVFFGIPVLTVFIPTLEVGIILASIILYLPGTNTISLTNDLHYWLVFLCLVLAAPICLLAFTHKAHILSCVLVGTTATILPIDLYLGTGLRYIFLNVVRRAASPQFQEAILAPLLGTDDLILVSCWLALAAVSLLCQLLVQRKRPPFPASPYHQWRWRREAAREMEHLDNETEPLLSADHSEHRGEVLGVRPRPVVGFIETPQRRFRSEEPSRKPRDIFIPTPPQN